MVNDIQTINLMGTQKYKVEDLEKQINVEMRYLPLILRKNGFTYTQVLREGRSCIYHHEVTENVQYFEVFTVKVKPETVFKEKVIPKREVFPCDEDFGKTAWSCKTLERAMFHFNKLRNKEIENDVNQSDKR